MTSQFRWAVVMTGADQTDAFKSPRWLCDHDRAEEGMRNLAHLHAHDDIDDSYVRGEFELIQAQIAEEHSRKKVSYLDLIRPWGNLRRTLLVCMIQAECQMTGISAIQYFSRKLLYSPNGAEEHHDRF